MKKLIAGLFAAILTTAGLVAVTSVSAEAACKTGYQCVRTTTKPSAPAQAKPGKPVKVKVQVKAQSGSVKANGTVTIKITGPGGFSKTVKAKVVNGKIVSVNIGKLPKPGKYKLKVTFVGADGLRDSAGTDTITVKKK